MRASEKGVDSNLACVTILRVTISVYTHDMALEKADDVFRALLNPFSPVDVVTLLFFCTQRKNLTKKSPVIMPIVTEDFNIEKYAHVDALLANFQGVFLNQVNSVSSCAQFFLLTTAESVLFASLSSLPLQFSTSLLRPSSIT